MVRQIAPFGNVVQPGCSEWGSFTGFLIRFFGRKKELPAFFQPSLFPGPWDSHVPSVLEWKQGELFPVFRIGFRSIEGSNAPQFA